MSLTSRILSSFSLTVAVASGYVYAEQQSASAAIERIVVTTSTSAETFADSVNSEALAHINPQHIEQIMQRISGANLQRGSGVEYLPSLRSPVLTGAGACGSILTLIDNIALRAAGFCNINELFEAPLHQGQYIEVFKGPWSSIFGSNAQSGVINIVTADVLADDHVYLGSTLAIDDSYRLTVDANDADNQVRAQLALTDNHGWRDDAGFQQQQLQLKHAYANEHTQITSTFNINHLDQQTAGYITGSNAYKDKDLSQTNPNPEAYRNALSMRFASHIEHQRHNGDVINITPYLRYAEMDFLMHFLPGQPIEENWQRSVGLKSQYRLQQSDNWFWLVGIDSEYTQAGLLQVQDKPTQGSAYLQQTIPQGKHYDYDVDALYAGAFVRAHWQASDKFALQFGLRQDYQSYDYQNLMVSGRTDENGEICGFDGCRYTRPESREDSFSEPSLQFNAQYQLSSATQIFVNAGHGFRAPQATELYRLQRQQVVAELDAEQTDSITLGISTKQSQFNIKVAGYYSEKEDVIIRDSDFFNINGAGSRHQGIELDINWQLTEQLRYFQHSSFNRHTYTHGNNNSTATIAGNDMDSAPKHLHTAGLNWQITPQFISEIEYRFVDGYFTDAENDHYYQGHQLVNWYNNYHVNDNLQLQLQVFNLFAERYANRADYTRFSGDRYFPGQGRHGALNIKYQF
ncbi:TonB-dependent receptor [Thalassotalea maritima]|uniref:TonB-dependent receptor n=1 Tax=Thalassotalea maritima TaxID=3242416 RepID=UPI003528071D